MAHRSMARDAAMDIVDLLVADHEHVKELFVEYEDQPDDAYGRRREIAEEVFGLIEKHLAEEEALLYPVIESRGDPDGRRQMTVAREDHATIRLLLGALRRLSPRGWRFEATFAALEESVVRHFEDEEGCLFACASHPARRVA